MERQGSRDVDPVPPNSSPQVTPGAMEDQRDISLPSQPRPAILYLRDERVGFDIPEISSPLQSQMVDDIFQQHHIIDAAMAELRRIKTSWYATLPISRIPPEILSSIFLLLAQSVRAPVMPFDLSEYSKTTLQQAWSWLPISRVCRHWRQVALNYPPLWAWIAPAYGDLPTLSLERSGQHLLTVRTFPLIPSTTSSPPPYLLVSVDKLSKTLYPYWPRIEKAGILVEWDMLFSDADAPHLRSLAVCCRDLRWYSWSTPLRPLSSGTPKLTELFWVCDLYWHLLRPLFSHQLSALHVEAEDNRSREESGTVPARMWLDALRQMPCLRHLRLGGVVRDLVSLPKAKPEPVVLPHLEVLHLLSLDAHPNDPHLVDHLGEAYVLAHLEIPVHAKIRYNLSRSPSNITDTAIANLAATLSSYASDKRHKRVEICYDSTTTVRFKPRLVENTPQAPARDDTILLHVIGSPARVLSHLCFKDSTEMSVKFQYLEVSERSHGHIEACNQTLSSVLRAAPRVESLTLRSERALQASLAALQSCVRHENTLPSSSCVLPNLQVLTFEDTVWHAPGLEESSPAAYFSNRNFRKNRGGRKRVAPEAKPLVNALVDVLTARSAQGSRLATLRIVRAELLTAADVEYIRSKNCAETVDWDGVYGFRYSDGPA